MPEETTWRRACLTAAVFVLAVFLSFVFTSALTLLSIVLGPLFPGWLLAACLVVISLTVCTGLFIVARRQDISWLKAFALGGSVVPVLSVLFAMLCLLVPSLSSIGQLANQQQPVASPSGKYVLTIPIERQGGGHPFWHVTIKTPQGELVYRDAEESFAGQLNVYWVWDTEDRVWLYNSDDGRVYFWEEAAGTWVKRSCRRGVAADPADSASPPAALFPHYAKEH